MNYLNELKLLSYDSYILSTDYMDDLGIVNLEHLAANPLASDAIKSTNKFLKENKLLVKIRNVWFVVVEFTGLKFTVVNDTETLYYTTVDFARLEAEFKKE